MSLYFVNSPLNHPVVARSIDDLHIRKPILLAPHQANPLIDNIHLQYLGPTWRLATTGREELLQGKRFENAVWRLWGQQLLGAKKIERTKKMEPKMPRGRYWREKELWIPIVVSQESFHGKHELFLIKPNIDVGSSPLANAMPLAPKSATEDVLLLRTCLKRGTSSVFESESPLSLRSSLPSSSPAASSPGTRQVLFNTCVERSEIAAAPFYYACPDDESGSSLGLIFNDDQYQDVYSLNEVLDQFRPQPYKSVFEDDSSDEDNNFSPMLPTMLLDHSDAILLPLCPVQIAPLPSSDSDPKVLFVAPKGMEGLYEEELRPYEARPLRRRVRIVDISDILFDDEEEEVVAEEEVEAKVEVELEEPAAPEQPEASGSKGPEVGGLSRLASGDSWFTDGWLSDNWRAPVEDENAEYEDYEPFSESEAGGTSRADSSARSIWEEQGAAYNVEDDEGEEVDGELYYDCKDDIDWEDFNFEAYSDDEEDESPDGFQLIGMVANSVSSLFW